MADADLKIWQALKARIREATLGLHVSFPGEVDLPGPIRHIVVARLVQAPQRVLIRHNDRQDRRGSLILTDVSPLGSPESLYIRRAADIAGFFPEGLCLTFDGVRVEIYTAPHVQEGYRDGGFWRTPVIISWRSFA